VANKTGTYLKALAAHDNNIPFYVALPTSTIDISISDGVKDIIIEERNPEEVSVIEGISGDEVTSVRICEPGTQISNPGFDITPSKFVSGLITEKGICNAIEEEILNLLKD
jgi:methylthioribose-1-phosphate isomerase